MRGGRQSSDVMEQAQQIMNDAGTGETNPAVTGGEMIPQDAQAGEIPGQRTRFLSMQERKQATELLMAGHSVSSIAKVLERSIPTISRVKKEVLKGKSWNEKRSKKRKSKFDNPETIAMMTQHWDEADGELTYEKIAELLGCSTSTAWAFVRKQEWKRGPGGQTKKPRVAR